MKANYLFVLFAAVVFASSCKKQGVKPAVAVSPLVAKWSIAKDSITTRFLDTITHYNVYVGSSDDYYDFRADGKCYIHENGAFDTLSYKIITDNSVAFGGTYPSAIDPLTNHSAKIDFSRGGSPGGGYYSRMIFLKK
jgi:hypothetical protein